MRKFAYVCIACLIASIVFSACKSDDDDTKYSSNCFIQNFVLGNMKRALHTTTSAGTDSIYYTTLSGSAYTMVIDQLNGTITNSTPIPTGAVTSAVLATITSQGVVFYAHQSDTTTWTSYSASDSIDFSSPLLFRVLATDGSSYRDYTCSLTIREADADSFTWSRLATIDALEQRNAIKLTATNTIFSSNADGEAFIARSEDLTNWEETPCTGLPTTADVRTTQCFNGSYWMSTTDGALYSSTDAVEWTEVEQTTDAPAINLIAASSSALYATLTDKTDDGQELTIVSSTDGSTWTTMQTEEPMFTDVRASLAYTQTNGNERVLLATNVNDDEPIYIWSLLEGYDQPWTIFSETATNPYLLPQTDQLSIVNYNDNLLAILSKKTYISYDNGITWKAYANLVLPSAIYGTQQPLSAYADGEYIHLVAGSQIWRTRLNSYGE